METIFLIITLISFIAVFAFVIKALLGFVKKDGKKGKKQFKKAGISFALMIVSFIGFAITTDPVESTDEGDKEQVETAKVEKEKEATEVKSEAKEKEVAKEVEPQTPEKRITTFINKELGKETNNDKQRIVSVGYSGETFAIVLNADNNLTTNLTRTSMLMDASDIFEELQGYEDITGDVTLAFMLDLVDQYGNTEAGRVMSIRLTQETLDKINFENFNTGNYKNVADVYLEHRAISEK